jgi:hypothetical protein
MLIHVSAMFLGSISTSAPSSRSTAPNVRAGLLAYRELDDALGLMKIVGSGPGGHADRQELPACSYRDPTAIRVRTLGRYEDVNEADGT